MTADQEYRDTYAIEYKVLTTELAHLKAICVDCRSRFQKDVDEMFARLRALEEHDARLNGHLAAGQEAQKQFLVKLGLLFAAMQGFGVVATVAAMIYLR